MITVEAVRGAPSFRRDRRVHGWLVIRGLSDAGDAAWTIALAWTAVQLAAPALAGVVLAAGTVPRAVLLLVGGVVADRADTRRILIAVTCLRLLVLGGGLVAMSMGGTSVPLLIALASGFGCSDALFEPSSATLGRQLVSLTDLTAYTSASQSAARLGTMLGAALGGGLVSLGGLAASAWFNAATYAVLLLYLCLVLRLRFPLAGVATESALRSVKSTAAYLRQEAAVRRLVIALSGLNLAVAPALGLGLALLVSLEDWGAQR